MCRVSFLCMAARPSRPLTDASMYSCILPCMGKNREKKNRKLFRAQTFTGKLKEGNVPVGNGRYEAGF
jgi:hypothetical protein